MGASLYWEPKKRKKHSIGVSAPQSFMDQLERVFGSRTPIFYGDAESQLRVMGKLDTSFREAFYELADAVEKYGEIEITAEY